MHSNLFSFLGSDEESGLKSFDSVREELKQANNKLRNASIKYLLQMEKQMDVAIKRLQKEIKIFKDELMKFEFAKLQTAYYVEKLNEDDVDVGEKEPRQKTSWSMPSCYAEIYIPNKVINKTKKKKKTRAGKRRRSGVRTAVKLYKYHNRKEKDEVIKNESNPALTAYCLSGICGLEQDPIFYHSEAHTKEHAIELDVIEGIEFQSMTKLAHNKQSIVVNGL